MAIPNEVYVYLKEFDKEYGNRWELIPETDERLLKVRVLIAANTAPMRRNRVGRGNKRTVWTEEMEQYLIDNDSSKTTKQMSEHLGVTPKAIEWKRNKLGLSKRRKKGAIIYTDENGNEHRFNTVTEARIQTRFPRSTIYKKLKIGKEWRHA